MPDEPGTPVDGDEPTPAETPPVETPAPVEEDPVEVQGKKMVPLGVAEKLRGERQELKDQLEQGKTKLAQQDQWIVQAQPILQRMQAEPKIAEWVRTGALPSTSPPEATDPALESMAKTLDLYDPSGKPDLARAKALQAFVKQEAQTLVDDRIKPLATRTAQGAASVNYEKLKATRLPDGSTVDPEILDHWWNALGVDHTQDPNVAATALLQAIGHQVMTGKAFAKPVARQAQPALVTDTAGGKGGRVTLTDVHLKIAKEMGVEAADFQKGIEEAITNEGVLEEF